MLPGIFDVGYQMALVLATVILIGWGYSTFSKGEHPLDYMDIAAIQLFAGIILIGILMLVIWA